MVSGEHETILQWYPEMILISKTPMTWKGFLSSSCDSNDAQTVRVKLKLCVPNYPTLRDAQLFFGKKVSDLCDVDFNRNVYELLHNATKVSTFLRQLQSLLSGALGRTCLKTGRMIGDASLDIIQELQSTLQTPSEVLLSSNDSLNTIRLSLRNISLTLQRNDYSIYPWKVIASDLPELPGFDPFEKGISSLSVARNKFKLHVEMLEKSWAHLQEIDKNCWVLDPLHPKPCHLYRRIYLTPSLSVLVTIDPLGPMDLPDIKFLGSDIEVSRQRDIVSNNLQAWNIEDNTIDNLKIILGINDFPQKQVSTGDSDKNTIVAEEECCICFSLALENENLPNKICSNERCRRHFHTVCLLEWLQTVAGNQVVFNYIQGFCPHCGEKISCLID